MPRAPARRRANRSRIQQLKASARRGPRTGTAVIPWQTSEEIVDVFLEHFDDNCTDGRVKPPSTDDIVTGGVALLPDLATGRPRPIEVVLAPSRGAFHATSLPAVGEWNPGSRRVTISPTRGACKPPASWRNILLSTVRHELTHAADPGLAKKNQKMQRFQADLWAWVDGGARGKPPGLSRFPRAQRAEAVAVLEAMARGNPRVELARTACQYVRDPFEARAFLTQVITEVELVGRRLKTDPREKGFTDPTAALRAASPTFREIEHCLTAKGRRKYLQAAARAWDAGVVPRRGR